MVTDAAVGAARRPVEVTGGTPLHAHLDALHVHVLVERRAELVVLVLVLVCCREGRWRKRATSTSARPAFDTTTFSITVAHYSPTGSTPASMKVAMVKLARTKKKRRPQHGGMAGQMAAASHGHLNMQMKKG